MASRQVSPSASRTLHKHPSFLPRNNPQLCPELFNPVPAATMVTLDEISGSGLLQKPS